MQFKNRFNCHVMEHNFCSADTNHVLYTYLTFILCCHANSSQNQTVEPQSYPLQVLLLPLVLETGPEHPFKLLAVLSAWLGISENLVSVLVCPAVPWFSHICLFTHLSHTLVKCFFLLCIFIAMHEPCPPDLL